MYVRHTLTCSSKTSKVPLPSRSICRNHCRECRAEKAVQFSLSPQV